MNMIINHLTAHPQVSDWKINIHRKESYELFFVKEKLETVRCTDTCDKLVTVYVAHEEYLGDAQFYVYASTTEAQLTNLIHDAVEKALLIKNSPYPLPENETGVYRVESNFEDISPAELAAKVANTVFEANTLPKGSLNSVEIFINRHTETVVNSRGIDKTQVRYDAVLETIPTYTNDAQSVELYHLYNFSTMDPQAITKEICSKMEEVKARNEAVIPEESLSCPVIFNAQELSELFTAIAWDLEYSGVYGHSNQYSKGDAIQTEITGDPLGITMCGQVTGSVRSKCFDGDGLSLNSARIVDGGKVVGYHGSSRFGFYLGEKPTGVLGCVKVDAGTLEEEFNKLNFVEIISMSGLQLDLNSDYIGGEIRLAYLYKDGSRIPLTGISVSGSLKEVLNSFRLSRRTTVIGRYAGPEKAITDKLQIF